MGLHSNLKLAALKSLSLANFSLGQFLTHTPLRIASVFKLNPAERTE